MRKLTEPWPEQPARPWPAFDVSIILNVHDEARYLRRSLRSLEEAVRFAGQFDISFEIVVVLDRADGETRAVAQDWDYGAFDAVQIIHVDNGSLGLSRNDGIAAARGDYVTPADADDLVAFDCLQKLYMTARSLGGRAIVFPEYYVAFGIQNYVWRFHRHSFIGNATFFERHPYVSRLIFRRDIWNTVKFADASLESGYAYEDWHFNCECLAAGHDIEVATGSVLFYRQRPGSLMRRADAGPSRLIPKSRYFEPATFLKLNWAELANLRALPKPEEPDTVDGFLARPGIGEIMLAANRIDPAVSLGILRAGHAGSNLAAAAGPAPAAAAYFALCHAVAGCRFTDVVLLPFLTKGGAEKYILSVLDALLKLTPNGRVLVLAGQAFESHDWLEKLPQGSVFVDLHGLAIPGLQQQDVERVTFRLLQHLDGLQRIHVKDSEFGAAFIRSYASLLREKSIYFYYFCEGTHVEDGLRHEKGFAFDLISECSQDLAGIISDHDRTLRLAAERIGTGVARKAHTLYAMCDPVERQRAGPGEPRRRLLWASRIDEQKRPDLVRTIAARLGEEMPGTSIEAFGETTYGRIGPEIFEGVDSLRHRGCFSGFSEIPRERYDALLYTSLFDGLPNIILEAMAAGMPVIAPDIGGIGEAVTRHTGYLVDDDPDEDALVARYVEAIRSLYRDWPDAVRRGENGRRLVAERHSRQAHLKTISVIFRIEDPRESDREVPDHDHVA